jgi:hypothetical protein
MSPGSLLACVALLLVALLAFDPMRLTEASAAERITLFFLALCAAVCAYSPLRRHFQTLEAATFIFTAAWFVMYTLARRAGPAEGWEFSLAAVPDVSLKISYAARIAIVGALTAAALNRAALSAFTRAALSTMVVAGVLLLSNFAYLAQFFIVGDIEQAQLNPVPLALALMNLLEFGSVAVLCGVAAADARVRSGLMKLLPVMLLLLWARTQFGPIPAEEDE